MQKNGVANFASFVYGPGGERVKGTVDGVTTIYVGTHFEKILTGLEAGTERKYYYAGSQRIAMRQAFDGYFFLLGDHLGSTTVTASSGNGSEVGAVLYKAWGEERYSSGTVPTTFRYTGQREEANIGLYYYGARWYDSYIARWIQPDTIDSEPGKPQSLNRFSYVGNEPLGNTDPTGHREMSINDQKMSDYTNYQIDYGTALGEMSPYAEGFGDWTVQIGLTGGGGWGEHVAVSGGIVFDGHGNVGVYSSEALGEQGLGGASWGVNATITNAPTIYDLKGSSMVKGVNCGSPEIPAGGLEWINGKSGLTGEPYWGIGVTKNMQASVGIKGTPPPFDFCAEYVDVQLTQIHGLVSLWHDLSGKEQPAIRAGMHP